MLNNGKKIAPITQEEIDATKFLSMPFVKKNRSKRCLSALRFLPEGERAQALEDREKLYSSYSASSSKGAVTREASITSALSFQSGATSQLSLNSSVFDDVHSQASSNFSASRSAQKSPEPTCELSRYTQQ